MLGELIINGFLLPGAAVVVFLAVAARTGHKWLQALGVAAALVAASIGLSGLPELSPTDALGAMPYLALAAVAVTIFTRFFREAWQGWVVRLGFIMLGVDVLAGSMGSHTWGTWEGLAWWAGLSVVITASWLAIERLVAKRIDIAEAAAVTIALGAGAAAAAAISTLVIGIHVGAMATAVALVGLYAWRSSQPTGRLAVSTLVPIVGFLWVIALLYGGIPGTSMVLIAFAPLLALGVLGLGRRMERSKLGMAAASTVALVAIGSSVLVAEQPAADVSVEADDSLEADSGAYYPY
jgi:hypothetical protein